MQAHPKKALLFDKQDQAMDKFETLLQQNGFEVIRLSTTPEAEQTLAQGGIDLVLLDVAQAQQESLQLLRTIRADESLVGPCVIAISSASDKNAILTSLELGADEYLTLSCSKRLFKNRVEVCIGKKQLREQKKDQDNQEAFTSIETQLRSIISHAPLVVFAMTQDGTLVTLEGLGLSRIPDYDQMVGENINILFQEDPAVLEIAQRTFDGEPFNTYLEFAGAIWEVFVVPVKDEQGDLIGSSGLAFDVTHRKLAEIENTHLYHLLENSHNRLQALSNRLMNVQETERQNIARELHDEIGQSLTGLLFALNLGMREAGKDNEHLLEGQRLAREVLAMVREMSLQLRPAMLDDLGLIPTLEWHFDRYTAQTDIQVEFQQQGMDSGCGSRIETALYRIIQEALTNAARYANVDQVSVNLHCDGQRVLLEISDRGEGFDLNAVQKAKTSSGLAGMQDRVDLLGGEMIIYSEPSEGTIIKIYLPLEKQPDD